MLGLRLKPTRAGAGAIFGDAPEFSGGHALFKKRIGEETNL